MGPLFFYSGDRPSAPILQEKAPWFSESLMQYLDFEFVAKSQFARPLGFIGILFCKRDR
jgi:hypothetical protein